MGWFQRQQQRHANRPLRFGLKVLVQDGEIRHGKERIPLAGAHATVETAGELDKRVTATRFLLTGPLALAMRKTTDKRQLFLVIENSDDGGLVVQVDPDKHKQALEFATKLNQLAGGDL